MNISMNVAGYVVARRGGKWPPRMPSYRGVAAGSWWPLTGLEQDEMERGLTDTIQRIEYVHPPEVPYPLATFDIAVLRAYVEACDARSMDGLYGLVCGAPVSVTPPSWILRLRQQSVYLGIDVTYPAGEYSFIDDDYAPDTKEVYEYLNGHVNRYGLFDTVEAASEFQNVHDQALATGMSLESLEGATFLELWEDTDLGALRRVLAEPPPD